MTTDCVRGPQTVNFLNEDGNESGAIALIRYGNSSSVRDRALVNAPVGMVLMEQKRGIESFANYSQLLNAPVSIEVADSGKTIPTRSKQYLNKSFLMIFILPGRVTYLTNDEVKHPVSKVKSSLSSPNTTVVINEDANADVSMFDRCEPRAKVSMAIPVQVANEADQIVFTLPGTS